ncbi:MAG: DNA polymerase III subunit beta [Clostridia bacterium]|nr:DNA polymerase III subunit beta [Clostridia bacterium]MBR2908561.1 DNA polymerase III subunit beta [Clostridia bacterium]
MKITMSRAAAIEAISPMMCAVGKTSFPTTEGILIEAKSPDVCILTAYDTEKGVRREISARVDEEGLYSIPAQKFMQTLKVMEGEEITLEVDDKMIACIYSGKSSHKMNAMKGEDFPTIPRLKTEKGFSIGQGILKKMLSKVAFAMGTNDQRAVLNGCFFRVTENTLHLVSCDTFKLARCTVQTPVENKSEDNSEMSFSFIVPVKTVNELQRLLSDGEEEDVRIHLSRKFIVFEIDDIVFFSRLVDGDYIDYDRILMRNHRIFAEIDKGSFISALERAALVTEERIAGSVRSHVKLNFANGILKIMATSAAGSTYDEIDIDQDGDDLTIAFNNRFLIDTIRACDTKCVKVSMSSPISSINVEPVDPNEDSEDIFMLLPVRIKE